MITVKLFAHLRERAGFDSLIVAQEARTIADLLKQIEQEHPALAGLIAQGGLLVAVNQDLASGETPVQDGDEVAIMPPFSGGSK